MHEILAVAHGRDLDGIACHAILHRYARLKGSKIRHFFVDYENFYDTIRRVFVKNAEIVIADIGYNGKILESAEALRKLGRSNSLKWFDHHTWPRANPLAFVKFKVDKKTCGAVLVFKHYLPRDSTARELAKLAYYSDFKVGNARVLKLQDVMASGYGRSKLTKLFSRGVFWNAELEKRYRRYQGTKRRAYKYLDANSKYYKVGKWRCAIGLSPDELSSVISTERLLKKRADFVICMWKSGKISCRKNNAEVNIEKIAKIFNGGGREIASGGSLGRRINEKNYLKIFDEVIEKVRGLTAT